MSNCQKITSIVMAKGLIYITGWNKYINVFSDFKGEEPLKKAWQKRHNEDCLSLCTLEPNLIASSSYDGSSIVWSRETTESYCLLSASFNNKPELNTAVRGGGNKKNIMSNLGSVPGEREVKQETGLYEGHAYSIINMKQVRTKSGSTTLLHMRNPWGWGERNGAWSDKSPEWKSVSEQDKQATLRRQNDGEFWISLTDFRTHFDELELCHLTPDALTQELAENLHLSQWHISEHYGAWVKGSTAGGPHFSFTSKKFWSNPQFELHLMKASKPKTVVVSLFEVDSRKRRDTADISIGFVIFKLQAGDRPQRITAENFYEYSPQMIETSGPYWPYRERTVRYLLGAGHYVIVACTFRAGQEAEFYLRVFAEEAVESRSLNEVRQADLMPMSPRDLSDATIDRLFDRLADERGVIDAVDLVEVLNTGLTAAEGTETGINLETCRCLAGLSNTDPTSGLIDKDGVRKIWSDLEMWRRAFQKVDKDRNKLLDAGELKRLFKIIVDGRVPANLD